MADAVDTIADQTDGLVVGGFANQHGVAVLYLGDGTTVQRAGDLTSTTYVGGEHCSNWPPADGGGYAQIAAELGFGTDLGAYNFEHELCHVLVPRVLFGERGYVSWMAAQGRRMSLAAAKAEERLIYYVQRMVVSLERDDGYMWNGDPQIEQAARILLAVRRHLKESAQRDGAPR